MTVTDEEIGATFARSITAARAALSPVIALSKAMGAHDTARKMLETIRRETAADTRRRFFKDKMPPAQIAACERLLARLDQGFVELAEEHGL